jgi:hypothetical protein
MIVTTGSFSTIGFSHKVCQDYIIKIDSGIVLCDGCSGSPLASTGARLIAHSIESLRPKDLTGWNSVINNCETICGRLNLPLDCLCSTLMWVEYDGKTNAVHLKWCGDGTVAVRSRYTGNIHIETISFKSGAPYYLRYEMGLREQYLEEFGDIYNDGRSYLTDFPAGIMSRSFDMELFDMVAVFSDGIGSLGISINEAVSEFLTIKGFAGDFMQRRGKAAMKKFGESGKTPFDDLTVGVLALI